MEANSIPTEHHPKVFLTNQSKATLKLISTFAAQMATPKEIENLTMEECGFHERAVRLQKIHCTGAFQVLVPYAT